jgi:DNA polymerase
MHICNNKFTNGAPTRTRLGHLQFGYHPLKYMTIRLPSGRNLFYYQPHIIEDGGWKEIHYLDGSKKDKKYASVKTYGGKLVENIVQATSRDILCHSAQLIDRQGLDLIFTVHDEVVVEVEDERVDMAYNIVHTAMSTVPKWCAGLPLTAETKVSQRYGK